MIPRVRAFRRRQFLAFLVAAVVALALSNAITASPRPHDAVSKRLSFSILEDWDKGEDLADVAKDFALFRELGITTWRGSFGWDDYEPSRGQYDFEWLHRFADLAEEYGITLRPYIGYTPEWAAAGGTDKDAWNDPPRNMDDWSRFVRALATAMRRHRNIASYEIYNEEDVAQWWDGPFEAYNEVLKRAAREIHAVSPGTEVLLGGMVFPDVTWVQHVCLDGHNGPRIAVVPFHAYPETWTPPDVDLERYLGPHFADGLVKTADATCGRKPIWINEAGFATVDGRTELDQADWWTRAIATFAAAPRVEHIGVYEIKDLKPDREAIGGVPNYHLGITHVDRSKKLAFRTLQALVPLMRGALVVEDGGVPLKPSRSADGSPGSASAGADTFSHAFGRPDGRDIVFAWTKAPIDTVDIKTPHRGTKAIEHRLDGHASPYAAFDGRTLAHVELRKGHARVFEITR